MSGAPTKRRRLDSDDDDDNYAPKGRGSPLLQYAVAAALPTDELPWQTSADGEEEAVVAARESSGSHHEGVLASAEAASVGGVAMAASAPLALATSPAEAPAPAGPPPTFADDNDVPSAYKGLFSTELLNVLLVPLDAICRQSTMTDKLLAQYLPQRVAEKQDGDDDRVSAVEVRPGVYRNVFGIAPGFRWDGVVRGRGPVE